MSEPGDVVTSFVALYQRHVDAVYAYLDRRVGSDAAEELTAQTFLEAFVAWPRFDAHRGVERGWLFGIASNLLRHHRRHEERGVRALARLVARVGADRGAGEGDEEGLVERVAAQGASPQIARALADMATGDRDVLLLYAWAELSYGAIASALDLPIGTVRSRLNRARARLTSTLGPAPGDELRGMA